jgi:hypothetical protein
MTAIFSYLQQKQVSQEQSTFEENQELDESDDEVGDFQDNVLASSLDNDPEIPSTGDLSNDSHCLSEHLSTIDNQQSKSFNFLNLEKNKVETALPTVETKETIIAKAKFTAALKAIEKKATKLQETADTLFDIDLEDHKQTDSYYKYSEAAKAATSLHHTLKMASELYFKNGNKQAFKDIANKAISTARNSELKNHRGYLKQILGYSGLVVLAILSVATLGLAYAAAGGINYAINCQFFFSTTFNTDSINKVDDLENAVDAIATPTA